MTVAEILKAKYEEALGKMSAESWEEIKVSSTKNNLHTAECMYLGLEITYDDIEANGGVNGELFKQIGILEKMKMLSSCHGNYYGKWKRYWLTNKGFKYINQDGSIC